MKKLFCSPLAGVALLLSVQMQAASFAADKKLEIFSYWTSGGEAAALDALFQATKRADPGIEIINATVAGGGNRPLNRCYKHASREVILPTVGKSIRAGSCSVSMFKPTTANQLPTSIRAKVGIT